ncbi:MAG: orotidine-5'-phosphate decarboxylase [Enterobacterales bacterium]
MKKNNTSIIVALDYESISSILNFADSVSPKDCKLKIGKAVFTKFGPILIRELKNRGFDVFLDLKFHDIPNTVYKSICVAAELGVWMVNVHSLGGKKMMIAAKNALYSSKKDAPILVAVTILTSIDNIEIKYILGNNSDVFNYTMKLAELSKECGMNGVICSGLEAKQIRKNFGLDFCIITPGIRNINNKINDQKRITSVFQSKQLGINYIIIGRPIIHSLNPSNTLKMYNKKLENM